MNHRLPFFCPLPVAQKTKYVTTTIGKTTDLKALFCSSGIGAAAKIQVVESAKVDVPGVGRVRRTYCAVRVEMALVNRPLRTVIELATRLPSTIFGCLLRLHIQQLGLTWGCCCNVLYHLHLVFSTPGSSDTLPCL